MTISSLPWLVLVLKLATPRGTAYHLHQQLARMWEAYNRQRTNGIDRCRGAYDYQEAPPAGHVPRQAAGQLKLDIAKLKTNDTVSPILE